MCGASKLFIIIDTEWTYANDFDTGLGRNYTDARWFGMVAQKGDAKS